MTTAKTVELTYENGNATETVQKKIRKIKINQLESVLSKVSGILALVQHDEQVRGLIAGIGEELSKSEPFDENDPALANFTKEELEQAKAEHKERRDERFMRDLVGGFQVLLAELPNQAIELLSAASGIDRELLGEQDIETGLDVFDAVIEVNDVMELADRLKKSMSFTANKMKFLAKRREATAATTSAQV